MPAFNKILIANRGAIATRIIRTLDRMGIASLAVYAQSDLQSLHVQHATEAVSLGAGGPADTYLNIDKLLQIAREHHCDAVHPGYGFLSENSAFVQRCEAEGLAFIGPTSQQMELFGQKHLARQLAQETQVPLLPGSELLSSVDEAKQQAARIGYPVMLKSTAGGGGIGMKLCHDASELGDAFESVQRLGASNFANDGVFLEKAVSKARHIEVQMFGDGKGHVLSIGERDCSAQRRNQKVIEECPAPGLDDSLRSALHDNAERLLTSISYRNAGTVEFLVDANSQEFFLLEVNTRLQVEHGVTEMVYGIDLVEWMVQQSASTLPDLQSLKSQLQASGHAIQMRLYAEDPHRHFQPCAGPLTQVRFPSGEGIRVDHWLESGIEVPADFDPMLAKLIAHAPTRKLALKRLQHALDEVELYGSETNLNYLRALCVDKTVSSAQMTTRFLDTFIYHPARVDVLSPGTLTTLQDLPGRSGYWSVGIPPSGPFDSLSFALGNQLLSNASCCAGLEITLHGPSLKFSTSSLVIVTGADVEVKLDDQAVNQWTVLHINAGQTLSIGSLEQEGARAYLCVAGGFQCPEYLGSRSTFTLGKFGGHNGMALKTGDVLQLDANHILETELKGHTLPVQKRPIMSKQWHVRVIQGPHSAPDFFTNEDISMLFDTAWQVHYNSSRTGVRLIGPTPQWARSDGGEAGLHPSNIHDNAYAFGSIDFTGDMPVILGPDGPSLGGFVCPATVISADLWKLGQLRANDTVSFEEVGYEDAVKWDKKQQHDVSCASKSNTLSSSPSGGSNASYSLNPAGTLDTSNTSETSQTSICSESSVSASSSDLSESSTSFHLSSQSAPDAVSTAIITTRESSSIRAVYRAAGDRFLLIEYGDAVLSMESRFRVHALMQWIEEQHIAGVLELTPGIRSLQVHFDSHILERNKLLEKLVNAESYLDTTVTKVTIPSRIVHLPLSWDDEACQEAIEKYQQSVREDAPWYPSNLEFIRRINGLDSIDDVKKIVFDASYLVMGLGDVYLGAPVATPINPGHRLVTTKYNPARTWTAENSVGIGGSYLCVYGMEGPGGYQFVGRTLQMWNRYKSTEAFTKPWLLRFFDQIRFYEVSHDELMDIRQGFPNGSHTLTIENTEISLAQLKSVTDEHQSQIQKFTTQRQAAFADELERWRATGQFNIDTKEPEPTVVQADWPSDSVVVESPVSGNLWKRCVTPGDTVVSEQPLVVLESMKMEISINAPTAARVRDILFESGQRISAGQPLIILEVL